MRWSSSVRVGLLVGIGITLPLVGPACDWEELFGDGLDCDRYESEYATDLEAAGYLKPEIPDSAEDYAMALILNQTAVNDLFSRLSDTELPELSQGVDFFGIDVELGIIPEIPLLQIGGTDGCTDCIAAEVTFHPTVSIDGYELPGGAGTIGVQMPVRMVPVSDRHTTLTAQFQSLEVTTLFIDLGNEVANEIQAVLEPIATTLMTVFLQSRFEDARIATFDSWQIGQGNVLLAGRGPFVYPDQETIVIAMQTNLEMGITTAVEHQVDLPMGSDIGVVFHPELLLSMSRRMHYEGEIPQTYSELGTQDTSGAIKLTLDEMRSDDDGLMRVQSRLWVLDTLCGNANLGASMGLSVSPEQFTFTVQDLDVSEGAGSGLILEQADWVAGDMMNSLVETLEVTANYDQIMGGETEEFAEMEAFQFNVDGRGLSLYFNLLEGI